MVENRGEEFIEKAMTAYEEAVAAYQKLDSWTKIDAEEGVHAFTQAQENGFDALKVEMYIDKPPQAVSNFIFNNWNRIIVETVGDLIDFSDVIHRFNDTAVLYKEKLNSPVGIVDPRILVNFHVHVPTSETTFANVITSVDHAIEEVAGCVKGDTKYHLHLCEPVGDDATRTHLVAVQHADPGGNIPTAVANAVTKKRVLLYEKLKEILAGI
jgi:hypothetical protein